jgi:SAM-dependent methyltransferase
MSAAWFFDSINGHPLPVLIVRGWCTDRANVDIKLECSDGTTRGPDLLCREPRHDVVAVHMLDFFWPGFIAEFHLKALPAAILMFGTRVPVYNPGQYCVTVPHYYHLYETDQVLHRDDIYRSGPPTSAHPAVVELASSLLGSRILDFGCGNGDLVSRLRERGREAVGVEIDRPEIREHLCPDAAPHVTLYDGSLPLPYADKSFDSVVATEVIEHVHDPHAVAQELIRVAKDSIFVTVPDMSSIPFSWPTNTVPWHLLEGTHVNFFNARSLASLFGPRFAPANRFRLYNYVIAHRFIPGSIAILFAPEQPA